MKVIVNQMPKKASECLFARKIGENTYSCGLQGCMALCKLGIMRSFECKVLEEV